MTTDPLHFPTHPGAPADNDAAWPPDWFLNRDLPNEQLDLQVVNHSPGQPLVVTFGGFGVREPGANTQYAMQNFLKDSLVTQIQVRDNFTCWYHNGVMGFSTDVASTVTGLRNMIDNLEPDQVVCTGASGGGYASILFGTLLNVDGVIALTPQTHLERGLRCQAHGWLYLLKWTDGNGSWGFTQNQQYADLLDLPASEVKIDIVYGTGDAVDSYHAERMDALPNVTLIPTDAAGHGQTIVDYRDSGMLRELFKDTVAGEMW